MGAPHLSPVVISVIIDEKEVGVLVLGRGHPHRFRKECAVSCSFEQDVDGVETFHTGPVHLGRGEFLSSYPLSQALLLHPLVEGSQ